jgi:hypothetical protein
MYIERKPRLKKKADGLWECSSEPCIDRIVGTVEGRGVTFRDAYINWCGQQMNIENGETIYTLCQEIEYGPWLNVGRKWKALKQFVDRYGDWFIGGFICLFILAGAVLQTLAVVLK